MIFTHSANPIPLHDCIEELIEKLPQHPGQCIVFPRTCDEERERAKLRHPCAQKDGT